MNAAVKVLKYDARDLLRSRWLIGYGVFFAAVGEALLRFSGSSQTAMLSLATITLFVVPLVALVVGTVHVYNGREFTRLLLAQPLNRRQVFAGLYLGLTLPLSAIFALGAVAPFVFEGLDDPAQRFALILLLGVGVMLTAIFTAVAFLVATVIEDRLKGLGVIIAAWLAAAVVYDGLVLIAVMVFRDYSLEQPLLVAMFANPIDLSRVLLLLQFDASALLGYTGAVFHRFFAGAGGVAVCLVALALWIVVPVALGARAFGRKDF